MKRIDEQNEEDRELAKQVFSWVVFARRPLSVSELQHAVAVTPEMNDMDAEAIIDEDILTSVCAGLVVVEEEQSKVT